jgi:cytokinin dehydrogenase
MQMLSRRRFLEGLTASAVVVGFDPLNRKWVTAVDAATMSNFDGAPALVGRLLIDAASRAADATDEGNIVHMTPAAVLQPGSINDISKMIKFCGEHRIHVSTRGHAHTTYGQGLCDGLIIENTWLNQIHSVGPTRAVVDTGVSWKQLLLAAYQQKLTPPVLTGYVGLSIGGTLSVGGIGGLVGTLNTGLQVDHVRELEVVTGAGDIVMCSHDDDANDDLFEVMLGGLGQCGVITRATIDLVPAKDRARTYNFHYTDNAQFFRDLRALLEWQGIDHVFTTWFPPGTTSLVYQLQATVFYDLFAPPSDGRFLTGLSVPPVIEDLAYLDYAQQIDLVIDAFRATMSWDRLVKPWFDVWLPNSTVEQYLAQVVPTLTPSDIGPTGFILLFAQRRSRLTRPFVRVPAPDGSDWVFLFDILTASPTPAPGAAYTAAMVQRNDRLFALARDRFGGVRYPVGTLDFTVADWQQHYGPLWGTFLERKQRFDPNGILTPGPGVFVARHEE